jgi:hypothetical protein
MSRALSPQRLRGLVLAIIRHSFFNLASCDPHDMNCIADHDGGAVLALGPRGIVALVLFNLNTGKAVIAKGPRHTFGPLLILKHVNCGPLITHGGPSFGEFVRHRYFPHAFHQAYRKAEGDSIGYQERRISN